MAMTDETPTTAASDFTMDTEQQTLSGQLRAYLQRFKTGGELGLLPAFLAIVLLTLFFVWRADKAFATKYNFGNYWQQAAPICMLAAGVSFVLLLGEIDLGAGYTAGVSAAILADQLRSGSSLVVALLLAIGAAFVIGFFNGWLVARVGIPSFVVTLSGFLAWQGVLLLIAGEGGNIPVEDRHIVAIENRNMPLWLGWLLWVLVAGGYVLTALNRARVRRARNLPGEPVTTTIVKSVSLAAVWGVVTLLLSAPRGATRLQGVPWVILLVLIVVVGLTFLLNRTAWGRHLYAVGGNAEAARRAGINVERVKMSAFVMCSLLAFVAGIILASRLNSVDPQTGGNDTLLIAIGAAVIGGTSLFGGRGRLVNAVVGGLVFALINNGLPLLGTQWGINFSKAGPKFLVNGAVLLLFASIDALTRKRAGAT
jgi:D-xylose transport system permease protein